MAGDFESLLDALVPGTGRSSGEAAVDDSMLPKELGLEPMGILGRGAVGTVFRARDPVLDRIVAVKIAHASGGAETRQALLREARLTASLSHPAVLPVHRVTAAQGLLCVEYRLAPEQTLERLWTTWTHEPDAAWGVERRLAVVRDLCGAVRAAHHKQIVHGDIHPGNVGVGGDGSAYLMDWSGAAPSEGLTGHPGYAAPECLRGEPAAAPADVYALAALTWEILTLRRLRPRASEESLGAYVARWRDAPLEAPSRLAPLDPALDAWVLAGLGPRADRPGIDAFLDTLERILTGQADRARRAAEASRLLADVRRDLVRLSDLGRRREAETRAAGVLISKVPGHADIAQKRPAWAAEDRSHALAVDEEAAWIHATETATLASTLAADGSADPLLAQLWFERMRRAEAEHEPILVKVSAERVRAWDHGGPYTQMLDAPASLSMYADGPGTAALERFVERDRRLIPEVIDEVPLPIEGRSLPPGSYRLRVKIEGRPPVHYPVLLERGGVHHGQVQSFTAAQIGDGFVHVPAGTFRMGGDPRARQPLEPCEPWVGDIFIGRTMVTAEEYLAFLNAVDIDTARRHAPGEQGFLGGGVTYWPCEDGVWTLPPGWDPKWPAFSVHMGDIEAYCAWRSELEGRRIRLPTEEEWEKAARGVDGRAYPWGPGFDPTYAHMRRSRPGPPRPWRVLDYPVDESVFGCRDMGGGMREWTSSLYDEGQIVIRGGTWGDDAEDCRSACRSGIQRDFRYAFCSWRLCTDEPRPV